MISCAANSSLSGCQYPPAYLDALERFCRAGGGDIDADTTASAESWDAAVRAAGAGLDAIDRLDRAEATAAFCVVRLPAITPQRGGPWGSASSTTSLWLLPPWRRGLPQEHPDTSSFTDPEIVQRLDKKQHVGFVLAADSPDRVEQLLTSYMDRIRRDYHMVLPPATSATA